MSPSERSFGEAYIDADFDVEGDLNAVFPLVDYLRKRPLSVVQNLRMIRLLLSLPRPRATRSGRRPLRLLGEPHSKERDRKAVTYHYDLPAAFFSLWLDPQMVYSCGYFESEESGLGEAQERKLDRICRKLRLEKGQRFLDLGCGWGGLLIFACRHYGVSALGVTLSQSQADFARAEIERAGLKDRCEVRVADYRDLDQWGQFDRLASVGMFEHVGAKKLEEVFPPGVSLASARRPVPQSRGRVLQRRAGRRREFRRGKELFLQNLRVSGRGTCAAQSDDPGGGEKRV